MSDQTLIARVQKYLEAHINKTYVDINEVANELQETYSEYAILKRSAFRASVKNAYAIVLSYYGVEDEASAEDSNDSSIDESDELSNNTLNNRSMAVNNKSNIPKIDENEVSFYKKSAVAKEMDEDELIDISSDDSDHVPTKESNNAPLVQADSQSNELQQPIANNRGNKRMKTINVDSPRKKRKLFADRNGKIIDFSVIGGMKKTLEKAKCLLFRIRYPNIYREIGTSRAITLLLHGPPGCGKTLLATAIAGEFNLRFLKVASSELLRCEPGEIEKKIKYIFERAYLNSPCVIFFDEIDAISPKKEHGSKDKEKSVVNQLALNLDKLNSQPNSGVYVIGATNSLESVNLVLRSATRFNEEIPIGIPNKEERADILKILCKNFKLDPQIDYNALALLTPGYVGADLLQLIDEASKHAGERVVDGFQKSKEQIKKSVVVENTSSDGITENKSKSEGTESPNNEMVVDEENTDEKVENQFDTVVLIEDESHSLKKVGSTKDEVLSCIKKKIKITQEMLNNCYITMNDFKAALDNVQPIAKKEGFATVPHVTWEDVGSLHNIRKKLQLLIKTTVMFGEEMKSLEGTASTGILVFGPSGCGKTLLANAMANEAGINFISVKAPALLDKCVGESERAVTVCFERARNSAPCVLFFDDIDTLCPKITNSDSSGISRVVNRMLIEMDSITGREGVIVLAATNKLDMMDEAVLRRGRLGKILYVGLPNVKDRIDILNAITRNGTRYRLAPDVSLVDIAENRKCEGLSGADLKDLILDAYHNAMADFFEQRPSSEQTSENFKSIVISMDHFNQALTTVRPSVSDEDRKYFENMQPKFEL